MSPVLQLRDYERHESSKLLWIFLTVPPETGACLHLAGALQSVGKWMKHSLLPMYFRTFHSTSHTVFCFFRYLSPLIMISLIVIIYLCLSLYSKLTVELNQTRGLNLPADGEPRRRRQGRTREKHLLCSGLHYQLQFVSCSNR